MKKFYYLEDYIHFMDGQRDVNGQMAIFLPKSSPLRLANCDVQVIRDLSLQINQQLGFTDKQRDLVLHLIKKYARQLRKFGLDQPGKNIELKNGLRLIDRTQTLYYKDNKLILRFPFNQSIINTIRDYKEDSRGSIIWNKPEAHWEIAVTEHNLIWAVELTQKNNFDISKDVLYKYKKLKKEQSKKYKIELDIVKDKLVITNSNNELKEYVEKNLGGFHKDNLYQLIDYGGLLGYTISDNIKNDLKKMLSNEFINCLDTHYYFVQNKSKVNKFLEDLINWMHLTDNDSIVFYDPLREVNKYIINFDKNVLTLSDQGDIFILHRKNKPANQDKVWTIVSFFTMNPFVKRKEWSMYSSYSKNATRSIFIGFRLNDKQKWM